MGDFDEMLRAGVISPGSTPYVEGKRAPATEQDVTTAQVTVTKEVRTSATEHAGPPGKRPVQFPTARVLVVSASSTVAMRVDALLHWTCHTLATVDGGPLLLGLTFDLVLVDAAFPELEQLVARAPNARMLLLADALSLDRATALQVADRVIVLAGAWGDNVLTDAMRARLGSMHLPHAVPRNSPDAAPQRPARPPASRRPPDAASLRQRIDVAKLQEFVGYGPKDARLLFLGAEEHSEGHLLNLAIRSAEFPRVRFDKNQACALLAAGYREAGLADAAVYSDAALPGTVRTWKYAAMLAAALKEPSPCVPVGQWFSNWADAYRRLGTHDGDTFLGELFPFPKPGITAWPKEYCALLPYDDARAYYRGLWPTGRTALPSARLRHLREHVTASLGPSQFVVCYGRSFWDRFKRLFVMRESALHGARAVWHRVVPGKIEVGATATGARVAVVGFPWERRHRRSAMEEADVPVLVNALRALVPDLEANETPSR